MIMTQVQKLIDLATTNILLSSRHVSVTDLQIALKETHPHVLVEKLCSVKQRAQDMATTAISIHFEHNGCRRRQERLALGLNRKMLHYIFETKLLALHTPIKTLQHYGDIVTYFWLRLQCTHLFTHFYD